jgi:HAD superfamily hydrolase (TIGR01549 family)
MQVPPRDLRAILFDLDGTLLDSFQSHLEIYRATLARFGVRLTAAEFRRHYTPDWNEFYRRVGLGPEHWDAASVHWLQEAAAHRPRLFPGVADTLRELRRRFRLGLVTSGSSSRIRGDLERGAIERHFEVIVTADDVRQPKPAPDGLRAALHAFGLGADQALYVGDTEPDYEFARAAGVAFIGVASGFSASHPVGDYHRLAAVAELPALLGSR